MRKKFFAVILFLISLNTFSQKATLSGIVIDTFSSPMYLASVNVLNLGVGTTTDSSGNYSMLLPSGKELTISFSFTSCTPVVVTVNLTANESRTLNVSIQHCLTNLKTFTLFDDPRNIPGMTHIEIDKFLMIPSTVDAVNAFIKMLGGSNNNELSSQYNAHGGNFDENAVYVNDFEIYRPFLIRSGEQEGLSFVNSDMVRSIDFYNGGFQAKYGDKMSSVLDVTYKEPDTFRATVTASLLGFSASLEGSSKHHNRLNYVIGARQKSNQYLLGSLDTKGDYKPSFSDVQAFITYNIRDNVQLSFLGYYSHNIYKFVPLDRVTTFGLVNQALRLEVFFDGQEVDSYDTETGGLKLTMKPKLAHGKNLTLKFLATTFHTSENETYDLVGDYFIYAVESDLGKSNFGQNAYSLGYGTTHNFARNYLDATVANISHKGIFFKKSAKDIWNWGATYQVEFIDNKINEWLRNDSALYSLPFSDSVLLLKSVLKTKANLFSNRISGYVEDNHLFKGKRKMNLNYGIRFQYWDLNKQFLVSPRVQFSWKPLWKTNWVWRGAAGIYDQAPFFREMVDLNGVLHTDVKAQQSFHFVFGGDYNFKLWNRDFKFVTEAYLKWMWNLNPYEIDNVRIKYFADNSAHGYSTGIDFRLNGEIVKDAESWVSLSILKTMEDIKGDVGTNSGNWDPENYHNTVPLNGLYYQQAHIDTFAPGYIPRPTDQRFNFGFFIQDYIPNHPAFKVHLNFLLGSGLPFGPPDHQRYRDVLRIPPYRRVDIGFSFLMLDQRKKNKNEFWNNFKTIWGSVEVFNLLAVNNTISYLWIKDFSNRTYAIPNYLTSRRINLKILFKF